MSLKRYNAYYLAGCCLLVMGLFSSLAQAQFAASRAINKALEVNTRNAMDRVQLSLSLKEASGGVVVQKISKDGRYLLLAFEDNRPRIWDLETSRYWDTFTTTSADIVAGAIASDISFVTVQSDGSIARWTANRGNQ